MGPPIFVGNPGASPILVVAFWGVFYAWVLAELWLAWRRRAPMSARSEDRGSQLAVVAGVWLSVVLAIGLASAVRSLALPSARAAVLAIGIAVMIAGLALRWYAIVVLGGSFTVVVVVEPGQSVVDRGPYRFVRHPSYSGSLLTIVGVAVAMANPIALLGLLPALAAYAYRIRVEEAALSRVLGEPYRSYMRRTRRLVPFVL